MRNVKKEHSVKSLISLYTVVIGVSLSLAVVNLVNESQGLRSITASSIFLFGAFIATLFPFYHGALRHLDDAYIENDNLNIKDGALIIDFILLFAHALAFVVLAQLLGNPGHFAWILVAILTLDVLWGLFAHFASSSSSKSDMTAEFKWTVINFIFVGIAVCYLIGSGIYLRPLHESLIPSVFIMVACLIRSLVDYIWCNKFYFPGS